MKYFDWLKLVLSIITCELAGFFGSLFTMPQINIWYTGIKKPLFNPPNWVFGPVWTVLFVLMGVSLFLVWVKNFEVKNEIRLYGRKAWNKFSQKLFSGSWEKANIILIFALQLALNVLWSLLFFGMHSPGLAFFELVMLWFAIIFTIINFYRVSKAAAILLIPYILWVTFAGVLNYFIWILN